MDARPCLCRPLGGAWNPHIGRWRFNYPSYFLVYRGAGPEMEGSLPELTQQAGGNLGLEPRSLGRGSHQNTFTSDTATSPQEPLAMLKGPIALSAQLQVILPRVLVPVRGQPKCLPAS